MPQHCDKLYRVWNDVLETVTFLREEVLPGATLPTYVVDYHDGRRANTNPDMFELTELAAWRRYLDEVATGCTACRKSVTEAQAVLREARRSRALATRQVRLLTGRPVRLPVVPPEPRVVVATTPVAELPLSVRCRNRLRKAGIQTVGELCQWTAHELLYSRRGEIWSNRRNFGALSLAELERCLATYNFQLAPEVPRQCPQPPNP